MRRALVLALGLILAMGTPAVAKPGAAWKPLVYAAAPADNPLKGFLPFAGDFDTSHTLWGTVWAVVLFTLAVWWGTATFRKENA